MKKILQILTFILSTSCSIAQPLNIKEQYDRLMPMVHQHYDYHDLSTKDDHDCLGDGMSYILASLLNMYEATKDKAYLIKFIQECILIERK